MLKPELFLAQVKRAGVGLASARAMYDIEYHRGKGNKQEPQLFSDCAENGSACRHATY